MVELGEQIGHLISFRHVPGDLLAASVVIDMSVGIDDL